MLDISEANLARSTEYKLAFLLPDHDDEFTNMIPLTIDEANTFMAHERAMVSIIRVPANNPHRIVRELDRLSVEEVNGVAIMAPETAQVGNRDVVCSFLNYARNISKKSLNKQMLEKL